MNWDGGIGSRSHSLQRMQGMWEKNRGRYTNQASRLLKMPGRQVINLKELRTLLHTQQSLEDQTVWLTTAQTGFPVTADTQEVQTDRDRLLGKTVARFLHPAISTFIQTRWQELVSTDQAPSRAEVLVKRLEETWGRVQPSARLPDDVSSKITPQEKLSSG